VDNQTVRVYEARAGDWVAKRQPTEIDAAERFAARITSGMWRADIGCGPGWHLPSLGSPVLALDAAASMLALVPDHAPGIPRVRADVEALPLRQGALGAAWAHKSYQHVPAVRLPLALADLHRSIAVDGRLHLRVTSDQWHDDGKDPLPGRFFEHWDQELLGHVVEGAGFAIDEIVYDGKVWIDVEAARMRSLPDTVGPGMRVLLVGLNPSPFAADAGIGFARPGNRFWPAALASGLVTRDRDPRHALLAHGIGMTDLVKRATARADEVSRDEYRAGASRVASLVEWLLPGCVCFVGLSGYRVAVDRAAITGWQPAPFAGCPAYVMPNPSGINAHATPTLLVEHLRELLLGPRQPF
jgi:TDG/mug DNA glycosylase family protein